MNLKLIWGGAAFMMVALALLVCDYPQASITASLAGMGCAFSSIALTRWKRWKLTRIDEGP
jgi:uncharacterized membrane protein YfcA